MSGTLTVKQYSFFKLSPQQASDLPASQKYEVYPGGEFKYSFYESAQDNHLKVHLEQPIRGIYTWFVYRPHVELTSESARCAKVTVSSGVNVRKAPGSTESNPPTIPYGKIVRLTGAEQRIGERIWAQINYPYVGWISASNKGVSNLQPASCPVFNQDAENVENLVTVQG